MSLITWGPLLSVGHKDIDEQHQKLVDMLNRLNDELHSGQGVATLRTILDELVQYTVYHFGTEERLATEAGLGLSAQHKAEHDGFVADIAAFQQKFEAGSATLSVEVMHFLRDWLSRHIMQTDKKLALALRGCTPTPKRPPLSSAIGAPAGAHKPSVH